MAALANGSTVMPDAIWTFTGRIIRPLDPDPALISIFDIAHHLSNMCRFTGAPRRFYSVGEHSIHCATLVPPEERLATLLHDGAEAYTFDLARPVKHAPGLGEAYRAVERKLEVAIAERFGLEPPPPSVWVKFADDAMFGSEVRALMPPSLAEMHPEDEPPEGVPTPQCWTPPVVEAIFLSRFLEYGGVA